MGNLRDDPRTIKVRCNSWEEVEAFYREKLRGTSLVVKVPFRPETGERVTVALTVPSGLTFAIDGAVAKVGRTDAAGRAPVALRLLGQDVRNRLMRLVADARTIEESGIPVLVEDALSAPISVGDPLLEELLLPAAEPHADDVPAEERDTFTALAEAFRHMRAQAAHEVLGVAPDADAAAIRAAYLTAAGRHHPDTYGQRPPPVRRLAERVFAHLTLAYDRLRDGLEAEGKPRLAGPVTRARAGWLASLDDLSSPEEAANELSPVQGMPSATAQPAAAMGGSAQAAPVGVVAPILIEPRPKRAEIAPIIPPSPPPIPIEPPPEPRPTPVPFDIPGVPTFSATPGPIRAEDLFADLGLDADIPSAAAPVDADAAAAAERDAARAALENGRWSEALVRLAEGLRAHPRDRLMRALYHAARGFELLAAGDGVSATVQFETALSHDKSCAPARRALDDKSRLMRRGGPKP